VIRHPCADIYTRPEYKKRVADYFADDADVGEIEKTWKF